MYKLSNLDKILNSAGVKCIIPDNWKPELAGHGDFGTVKGVLCHHTAGAKPSISHEKPSEGIVETGRPDLPGPLCNLYLAVDGTFEFIAAGKAWHAGFGDLAPAGVPADKTVKLGFNGNSELIGIEAENTGLPDDPWPDVQYQAYAKGCAALLDFFSLETQMCAGHKEYARLTTGSHELGRKIDPSFDMQKFRQTVDGYRKKPSSDT